MSERIVEIVASNLADIASLALDQASESKDLRDLNPQNCVQAHRILLGQVRERRRRSLGIKRHGGVIFPEPWDTTRSKQMKWRPRLCESLAGR
jgi:hypothetical protein